MYINDDENENYVYKKEVDWSLLTEGLTLPYANQVIFGQIMGRFLKRGEKKEIKLYLDAKSYDAILVNMNNSKTKRKNDALQIRYKRNGDLAQALQQRFSSSFKYLQMERKLRPHGERYMIKVPNDLKEYLVIYTTMYDDSYVIEDIQADDIRNLRKKISGENERVLETSLNYDIIDSDAGIFEDNRLIKIRRLNKKVGDNLKLLYDYKCQICGNSIGQEFSAHIVEAHHIDYFVKSLNNNDQNIMILCPNHHSIIHNVNPVFDHRELVYNYKSGIEQHLIINKHLYKY